MSAFLNAIYAVARFFNALMTFLIERRQIQAGEDRATAQSLKEQAARVEVARAARRAVDVDSLPEHDPDCRD
jgi:hypothetical protein